MVKLFRARSLAWQKRYGRVCKTRPAQISQLSFLGSWFDKALLSLSKNSMQTV
jgi:hypothetical protein